MSDYSPDCWVIIEFTSSGQKTYKVFAGWRGGYLSGDSWKLSSGISEVKWENGAFTCQNVSGSNYICEPIDYGIKSPLMHDVYESWNKALENHPDTEMRVVPQNEFSTMVFSGVSVFLKVDK